MQTSSHHEPTIQDAQRGLVQRILASPYFSRSSRLADFLAYVCDRALEGRSNEISEQQIGVHVFKRAANYNPNDDSIVRSHARLLRQKLDAYFEREGSGEEIRLSIPKGRYVPCFEPLEINLSILTSPDAVSASPPEKHFPRKWIWAAAGVAFGLLVAFVSHLFSSNGRVTTHVFWTTFFSSGKKVLIVPGDSTLALIEDITHRQIGLTDYLDRRYHFDLTNLPGWSEAALSNLARHHYTSMADLNLTARLVRLPAAAAHSVEIRYARDLQLADLKEGSAVLIGGPRSNPWEELFQDKTNFFVDLDPVTLQKRISNRTPHLGEQKTYGEPQADSPGRAYGLLALLPGLRADTRTLAVEGTSSIGTECAADFLLDDGALGNFIAEISRTANALPFFEVVLQSKTLAGSSPQPEIVAFRIIK